MSTIRDFLVDASNEIQQYNENKNKKHLNRAIELLDIIIYGFDCTRVDNYSFLFTVNTDTLPFINKPLSNV